MRMNDLKRLSELKPELKVEWFKRISEFAMGFLLLWCALPLMFNDSTHSATAALGVSIIMAAIYWAMCVTSVKLGIDARLFTIAQYSFRIPPWAPVVPHAMFFVIGVIQFTGGWRREKKRSQPNRSNFPSRYRRRNSRRWTLPLVVFGIWPRLTSTTSESGSPNDRPTRERMSCASVCSASPSMSEISSTTTASSPSAPRATLKAPQRSAPPRAGGALGEPFDFVRHDVVAVDDQQVFQGGP